MTRVTRPLVSRSREQHVSLVSRSDGEHVYLFQPKGDHGRIVAMTCGHQCSCALLM